VASRLKVCVLGEFKVVHDGEPLALPPSRKTRALLAYLAVVARPQRRERLCEMFWEVPDDPRGALRWSLSRIRQVVDIGAEVCVRADRNLVALDPARFECDAHQVDGVTAEELARWDIPRLEALASAFKGGFLEDLYLPACPEFEAWRVAHADAVEVLRLRLLRLLVDGLKDEPQRALAYAYVLNALAPDRSLAAEIDALAARARQLAAGAQPQLAPARPAARAATPAPEPARISAEELRRQVSVLAAEIMAPLQEHADEDPEAGMAVIGPLLEAARREVERRGGIVLSATDASMVGIFGARLASEDHAFQACGAALAIKAAVGDARGAQVEVAIGLDSGEAVVRAVGDGEQVETHGTVVRTARRLAQALRRHAIVSTARMNATLAGYVTTAGISAADFAGALPVAECHEIVAQNPVSSRWQLRRARGLAPLTGRARELASLNDVWRRVRAGAGQCVGVIGDAGIGKSRLVFEFLAAAGAEARTLEVGVLESDAVASLHVAKKLLRAIVASEEGDDRVVAAGKIYRCLSTLGADPGLTSALLFALDLAPDDREWTSLPPSEHVRRVRQAISILLSLMANTQPLIVVVEDLNWIDAESGVLLDRLIDSIASQPILLLLTFRPDYSHTWSSRSNYGQLRLDPLPGSDAEALLAALLGDDASVGACLSFIAERTDGVPLFIEETIQALAQSGALVGRPGAYVAVSAISSLRVPATVQSVIAARIDRLVARDRRLLQNAAVIGRELPLGVLASVSGLDEKAAAEGVESLQGAGFLYQSHLLPTPVFTFKHALVQKVAYDSLVQSDRKALHGRLIDSLETAFPHLIEDQVEKLSEHAVVAERWDRAEQYLLRSGKRALQRSSHNLALAFLTRGLEILGKRAKSAERDRLELEYQKLTGLAWMAAKGWGAAEVLAAYERAEALCGDLADDGERFIALRGRAQYYMISGQPRAAQSISLKCAEMTKHTADSGVLIETHHMFWTNNLFMGECRAAEQHAEAAIGIYHPERHHALTYQYSGHDPGVCSQSIGGLAAWQRGALARAHERCHGALALAERLAHPLTTALAYWGLACLAIFNRQPEAALDWANKQIALCDEYLLPLLRSQGAFQAGWARAQLGDVAAGIDQMQQGVEAIRATGAEMGLPYFLGLFGETLAAAGQPERARAVLRTATESARHNGTHFLLSEILLTEAELLDRGKHEDVKLIEALFRRAVAIATSQQAPLPALRAATGWARMLVNRGRRAEACAILQPHAQLIADLAGSRDALAAAELL